VGAHLVEFGVSEDRIVELDWWEHASFGNLTVWATPARHFSGRSLTDRNETLWASWSFIGPVHRVFFSGDTGMHKDFAEIGRRLGPFDATLMESGAYDSLWADVHMGPEQAIWAHQLLNGKFFFPVHWGTFNLAMHSWVEPVERLIVAAERAGVRLAIPRPGESIEPSLYKGFERWWPTVPWRTAEESPVRSTGLEGNWVQTE
jgi:L-ascorbate metabolism protein UlaG (beta-lactamase superfamily)